MTTATLPWRSRMVQHEGGDPWLAARRGGIGGSDVPAILGLVPSRGIVHAWRSKVGLDDEQSDDGAIWLRWGHLLEQPVARRFEELTGGFVETFNDAIVTHATHPWLRYSPDGIVGERALYEGKSTAVTRASEWDEGVPLAVHAQVQHGMEVLDVDTCFVACFAGTHRDIIWTEVARNREWYYSDDVFPKLMDFWDYVESETPPPPAQPCDGDALARLNPRSVRGREIGLPPFFDELMDKYVEAGDRIREAEAEKAVIRGWVARELKDAEVGTLLSGRAWTFKEQSRKESVIPAGKSRVLRIRKARNR